MVDVDHGVVEGIVCENTPVTTPTITVGTSVPVVTSVPVATRVPGITTTVDILIPVTGADLTDTQTLATRQWAYAGLGALGLGLLLVGFALRRKSKN